MDINAIAAYCQRLWETRTAINGRLDEIASYVAPDRQGFASGRISENDEGRDKIWDSTPEDAAMTLACALHGMLTNPATDWLALELLDVPGDAGAEDAESADFIQSMTKSMLAVFSDPSTSFNNEVNAFYLDLVTLGWAVFLVEYKDGKGIRFCDVPPAQCAVAENADGVVDTVLRRWTMSPAQMLEEFGEKALSDKVRGALKKGDQSPVSVSHLVMPSAKLPKAAGAAHAGATPEADPSVAAPFVSVTFETETRQMLRRGRFEELPYMVPRWSKRSGEVYGRGPGHVCLPDMRVLNEVAFSQLVGAQKLADPPMVAVSDSVLGKVRSHSGGITYVDATQVPGGDPANALRQLPVSYQLDVAEAILEKRRAAIRSAFLNDRIELAGGPQMTATEVLARERRQMLILGPVHGRLDVEYLGPLVARVFLLLLRNGRVAVPEALHGRELRAKYISPISRTQRRGAAEAFGLAQQYLAPVAQIDPSIVENFDFNRVARDSQDLFGYPREYLRPEKEVVKLRTMQTQGVTHGQ